jgi:hypothetical protein
MIAQAVSKRHGVTPRHFLPAAIIRNGHFSGQIRSQGYQLQRRRAIEGLPHAVAGRRCRLDLLWSMVSLDGGANLLS